MEMTDAIQYKPGSRTWMCEVRRLVPGEVAEVVYVKEYDDFYAGRVWMCTQLQIMNRKAPKGTVYNGAMLEGEYHDDEYDPFGVRWEEVTDQHNNPYGYDVLWLPDQEDVRFEWLGADE